MKISDKHEDACDYHDYVHASCKDCHIKRLENKKAKLERAHLRLREFTADVIERAKEGQVLFAIPIDIFMDLYPPEAEANSQAPNRTPERGGE